MLLLLLVGRMLLLLLWGRGVGLLVVLLLCVVRLLSIRCGAVRLLGVLMRMLGVCVHRLGIEPAVITLLILLLLVLLLELLLLWLGIRPVI